MYRTFHLKRIPIPYEFVLHFLKGCLGGLGDGGIDKPEKSLDSLHAPQKWIQLKHFLKICFNIFPGADIVKLQRMFFQGLGGEFNSPPVQRGCNSLQSNLLSSNIPRAACLLWTDFLKYNFIHQKQPATLRDCKNACSTVWNSVAAWKGKT